MKNLEKEMSSLDGRAGATSPTSFQQEMKKADGVEQKDADVPIAQIISNFSDERSVLSNMLTGNTDQSVTIMQTDAARSIITIPDLWNVGGLPPIPDNIVDPPPIVSPSDFRSTMRTWGVNNRMLLGRDFAQRVLSRGQYLTLTPLEIQPMAGSQEVSGGVVGAVKTVLGIGEKSLETVENRLNATNYGIFSKICGMKYNRAVVALLKTSLVALGLDNGDLDDASILKLKKYLPDQLVDRVARRDSIGWGKNGIFSSQLNTSGGSAESKGGDTIIDSNRAAMSEDKVKTFMKGGEMAVMGGVAGAELIKDVSTMNLLKYVTNVDASDGALATIPFAIFYCNGPIERSITGSSSLGESAVAAMTVDLPGKMAGMLDGSGKSEDFIKELAYHSNSFFQSGASTVAINTYIPNVIKNSMLDISYSCSIREIAISSDRYSILRIFYTLCQILPFVVQAQDTGQELIVPTSPIYCAAFSKGVMNLPRAAITSVNIKTSPEFQTTEGIPTEFDINLTITPLVQASVIPDFSRWYNGHDHPDHVIAAMYNPMSAFNLLATYAGQNTVLTKINTNMFKFFVLGSVENLWSSITGTGAMLSSMWSDWMSNAQSTRTRIYATKA